MFCAMSSLYHHFIGMQRGQTRGGVLSVEKDKIRIFSTETLQWEEKRRMIKIVSVSYTHLTLPTTSRV